MYIQVLLDAFTNLLTINDRFDSLLHIGALDTILNIYFGL
jgi:hypothetical protein